MVQLNAMWDRLADLPAPEPSHALDVRWAATLESLVATRRPTPWRFTLGSLWPQRPVWQGTIAAGCLGVGLILGSFWQRPAERTEVARLREEVASTKEMVALALLQQQSATERLRGVDYSQRMASLDPQVISALVNVVQHDANVNVRLAAVDALSKVSRIATVRQSLTQSLTTQESPMVQAALIDYVVDAKDTSAAGALRILAGREDVNPAVRKRAGMALRELTQDR